tara:strand:- start:933 stop:1166 length:234 start_codon:yes stop_codon:yes gene_type:complete
MVYGLWSNYYFYTISNRSYLMDASKYKSVAIKVAVYNKARPMADEDYCTMGGFIQKLIDDEYKFRQEEKKNGKKVRK